VVSRGDESVHQLSRPGSPACGIGGATARRDLPTGVALVKLPDEKLNTDAMKVLKMYGWLGAAAVAGVAVWGALKDKK